MAGEYEFWLTDDYGRRLADRQGRTLLDNILSGTFQRVTNGAGRFSARFPASFDTNLIQPDYMVQVWRAPQGEHLSLWRTYLIRWGRLARLESNLIIELAGVDPNSLLDRRIVANYTQTIGSEKTDYADDMMKEIVDEQMVTDTSDPAPAFGSRTVPGFSVEADLSQGPSLSKSFAWQKVSMAIADIQRATRAAGTEVFWDIVESAISSTSIEFEFRTTIDQPAQDRTASVVFDEERGNLEASDLTYDWTWEANYVYAPGQGEDAFREVVQAYDADRIAVSRYGRIEDYAFATFNSSPEALETAARERLTSSRAERLFTGQPADTQGTVFGRDWNWGDRVMARFLGNEFEAIIRQVILGIDGNGRETIDARIESIDWI